MRVIAKIEVQQREHDKGILCCQGQAPGHSEPRHRVREALSA